MTTGEDSRAERARRRRIATALRRRNARRPRTGHGTVMPDLSRLPLAALASLAEVGNPILQAALDRIRGEAGGPTEALAGFNSAL